MARTQVEDDDHVELLDPVSGRFIYVCTQDKVRTLPAPSSTGNDDHEFPRLCNAVRMNVKKCKALIWDSHPEGTTERNSFVTAFVDLACAVSETLDSGNDVLIHCKNGRSRSPSIVLGLFLLFRRQTYANVNDWLNEAFQTQRPTTFKASANFPNFDRYDLVLQFIEKGRLESSAELEFITGTYILSSLTLPLIYCIRISTVPHILSSVPFSERVKQYDSTKGFQQSARLYTSEPLHPICVDHLP